MTSFQDKTGRKWAIELTIGIARKAFDISKENSLVEIIEDPYRRFDLLWMICEDQAKAEEIDVSTFDLLVADEATYIAANEALLETIEAFFRRIGKESLALLMTKTREAAKTLDRIAGEKVTKIDLTPTITKALAKLDSEIMKAGKLSSNSPESSELTPTP
jgi:hypothetical protein